ncbi:MAG: 23S rRNA (guanosine(2251)-2'-O)-methyltransferase RlmB [Spirochaetes bacterium]|nr:23S rRNA (guanosine(2251)-2'-O)-methyltransferase RlmB [Spirochaetota bacterium]MBN2769806.1 23S rRNA (guanosine(2251)-2'-O)-methyltransferase RlmB [Spirochaetota bacterium]
MENGIVFGRIPVFEYMRSGLVTSSATLLIASGIKENSLTEIISLSKKRGVRSERADKDRLEKLCGGDKNHQGIALINCPLYPEFEENQLEAIASNKGTVLVLDQLTDPHNIGAIIRSAEAFGCKGVIITKDNSASVTSTVIKSSAGASAYMPLMKVTNLARTIDLLKDKGFWIIGSSDKGQENMSKISEYSPLAIVIGSEGTGMRDLTEKKCDLVVRIELTGKVSSLNASVAASILLYEASKNNG